MSNTINPGPVDAVAGRAPGAGAARHLHGDPHDGLRADPGQHPEEGPEERVPHVEEGETLSAMFARIVRNLLYVEKVLAGMGAGGFGQLVASPTDLIKTHMQMEGRRRLQGKKPRVNGMMDAAR